MTPSQQHQASSLTARVLHEPAADDPGTVAVTAVPGTDLLPTSPDPGDGADTGRDTRTPAEAPPSPGLGRPNLEWYEGPQQIAELWSWLDEECWPSDNGRRPNVSTFIAETHRWSDDRERMLREERAAA